MAVAAVVAVLPAEVVADPVVAGLVPPEEPVDEPVVPAVVELADDEPLLQAASTAVTPRPPRAKSAVRRVNGRRVKGTTFVGSAGEFVGSVMSVEGTSVAGAFVAVVSVDGAAGVTARARRWRTSGASTASTSVSGVNVRKAATSAGLVVQRARSALRSSRSGSRTTRTPSTRGVLASALATCQATARVSSVEAWSAMVSRQLLGKCSTRCRWRRRTEVSSVAA